MAYFGRFTHLLLNEENVIRHFFCIVQRKAQREILGGCNDLLSCLICGCSCFLCAALAAQVIHGQKKITLAFGLLQAALLDLPHSHGQLWGTQWSI